MRRLGRPTPRIGPEIVAVVGYTRATLDRTYAKEGCAAARFSVFQKRLAVAPPILADRLERFVVDVVARNTKAMARYKAALRRRR